MTTAIPNGSVAETLSNDRGPFKAVYGNYINGQWVPAADGRTFENPSPVHGRVLCEVARSGKADVEAALDAAHAAKEAWGKTTTTERALLLNKIADVMEENLPLLALAETLDGSGLVIDLPNASYTYFDPRASINWPVSRKLAFGISGAFLVVTDAGNMTTPETYGSATITGGDADLNLRYRLTDRITVSVGAIVRQFFGLTVPLS